MAKWCFNYESGAFEDINEEGYSFTQGRYVDNWDDSEYRSEEAGQERQREAAKDREWAEAKRQHEESRRQRKDEVHQWEKEVELERGDEDDRW